MHIFGHASDLVSLLVNVVFLLPREWLLWPALLLTLALPYWFYRQRRARWHSLKRLRQQLAADLHDDIGSNLSQLAVLSEVLRQQLECVTPQTTQTPATQTPATQTLDALARIARESVSAMGDIVWTTNPEHDYLPNLVCRMRRFASELLPAAGIEFTFRASHPDQSVMLEAELRRQIFLIFKESLNNLVRHSSCTKASLELRLEGQNLLLQINDNGQGFDYAAQPAGNGLRSLRQRTHRLGAQLAIVSHASGTTITFCVRLPQPLWRSYLHQCRQRWQWLRGWSTSYLNRGVTVRPARRTIPSQPLSVKATKVGIGH